MLGDVWVIEKCEIVTKSCLKPRKVDEMNNERYMTCLLILLLDFDTGMAVLQRSMTRDKISLLLFWS